MKYEVYIRDKCGYISRFGFNSAELATVTVKYKKLTAEKRPPKLTLKIETFREYIASTTF